MRVCFKGKVYKTSADIFHVNFYKHIVLINQDFVMHKNSSIFIRNADYVCVCEGGGDIASN
jgi:hypothetical protein